MKPLLKIARLLRVHSWYYQMGIPLLAVLKYQAHASVEGIVRVAALNALYFCWGYVFNNLFDQDEDELAKNSFKALPQRVSYGITGLLQIFLVLLAYFNGLLLETLFVILLNALYSIPPFRLKRRLIPSLLINGVFFGFSYYSAVFILLGRMDDEGLHFCGFIFLMFLSLQYAHFLEHREGEGIESGFTQKTGILLLLGSLCLASRQPYVLATCFYSAACLLALYFFQSAKKARIGIRGLSVVFGIYLAIAFELSAIH